MSTFAQWAILSALIFLGFQVRHQYKMMKFARRVELDKEPVDFEDWKRGSPNDPVPEDAVRFDKQTHV
jgi:hypothetical protein